MKKNILLLIKRGSYIWFLENTIKFLQKEKNYNFILLEGDSEVTKIIKRWGGHIVRDVEELKRIKISCIITSYVHFYNSAIIKYYYKLNTPIVLLQHGFNLRNDYKNNKIRPGCYSCWVSNQNYLTYIPMHSKEFALIESNLWALEPERLIITGNLELDYYINSRKKKRRKNKNKKILIFLRYELPSFVKTNGQYLRDLIMELNDLSKKGKLDKYSFFVKPHPLDSNFYHKFPIDFPHQILYEPWIKKRGDVKKLTHEFIQTVDFIISPDSSVATFSLASGKPILMPINPDLPYSKNIIDFYGKDIVFWFGNKQGEKLIELFDQTKKNKLSFNVKNYIDNYWDGQAYLRFGEMIISIIEKRKKSSNISLRKRLERRRNLFPDNQNLLFELIKLSDEKGEFVKFVKDLKLLKIEKNTNPFLEFYIISKKHYFALKKIKAAKRDLLRNLEINIKIPVKLLIYEKSFFLKLLKKIKNIEQGTTGWLDDYLVFLFTNYSLTRSEVQTVENLLKEGGLYDFYEIFFNIFYYDKDNSKLILKEFSGIKVGSLEGKYIRKRITRKAVFFVIIEFLNKGFFKEAFKLIHSFKLVFDNKTFIELISYYYQRKIIIYRERKSLEKLKFLYQQNKKNHKICFNYALSLSVMGELLKSKYLLCRLIKNPFLTFDMKFKALMVLSNTYENKKKWYYFVKKIVSSNKEEMNYYRYLEIIEKSIKFVNLIKEVRLTIKRILERDSVDFEIKIDLLYLISKNNNLLLFDNNYINYQSNVLLDNIVLSNLRFKTYVILSIIENMFGKIKNERFLNYVKKFFLSNGFDVFCLEKSFHQFLFLLTVIKNKRVKDYYYFLKKLKEKSHMFNINLNYSLAYFFYRNEDVRTSLYFAKKMIKKTELLNEDQLVNIIILLNKINIRQNPKRKMFYVTQTIKFLEGRKSMRFEHKIYLAQLYKEKGELSKARKWFKRILKSCDDKNLLKESYFQLGEIYFQEGKEDRAFEHYKKALEIIKRKNNKQCKDYYLLGSTYKRIKEYKNSKKWFERLIGECKQKGLLSGGYFHLGEIAVWEGNKTKAKKYFRKCLDLNPQHKKAKQYLEERESK